jgi:SPP1 family predicted phage head-tail adaptor
MLFRDTIDLVTVAEVDDGGGGLVQTETLRSVFANKKSIRQTEFYQAMEYGLKPEVMFEIRAVDYADEPKIKHDGKTHYVIRTFSKNGEILELVCSTKAVGA